MGGELSKSEPLYVDEHVNKQFGVDVVEVSSGDDEQEQDMQVVDLTDSDSESDDDRDQAIVTMVKQAVNSKQLNLEEELTDSTPEFWLPGFDSAGNRIIFQFQMDIDVYQKGEDFVTDNEIATLQGDLVSVNPIRVNVNVSNVFWLNYQEVDSRGMPREITRPDFFDMSMKEVRTALETMYIDVIGIMSYSTLRTWMGAFAYHGNLENALFIDTVSNNIKVNTFANDPSGNVLDDLRQCFSVVVWMQAVYNDWVNQTANQMGNLEQAMDFTESSKSTFYQDEAYLIAEIIQKYENGGMDLLVVEGDTREEFLRDMNRFLMESTLRRTYVLEYQ